MLRTQAKFMVSLVFFMTACAGAEEPGSGFGIDDRADISPDSFRIIYAAGVNNDGFGDEALPGTAMFEKTQQAREALKTWINAEINRGALHPGFAEAQISMVGNDGVAIIDGPFGGWDEEAIEVVSEKLKQFKREYVSYVLVVSHSNGVITTQQGYTQFIDELPAEGSQEMCIHFHHTQAAGSQLGDFVPLDFQYLDGENGIKPTFRFTYNREDWLTYDPYLLSTVGRRESRPWVEEAQELQDGISQQLINPNSRRNGGGGGHSQTQTLLDLSTSSILRGYTVERGHIVFPQCFN